jgi:S-DNA-T family DNA segregation ATPase FtsK/SpoIIIE
MSFIFLGLFLLRGLNSISKALDRFFFWLRRPLGKICFWVKSAFSLEPSTSLYEKQKPNVKRPKPKIEPLFKTSRFWDLPSLDILNIPKDSDFKQQNKDYFKNTASLLEEALLDFGVEGRVKQINFGPVVTMYEFEPASGVKISQIASLADDLALNLKAGSIRIVAPIAGKSVVGIEVPNPKRAIVYLYDVLNSTSFKETKEPLALPLGKDIFGRAMVTNLAKMPHLLIAGATGTGKSICLNSFICGLLMRNSPDNLKLLLIDPKRIELSHYNDIPHLLCPTVTDMEEANQALKWAVLEMERRYELLAQMGVRNIEAYNESTKLVKNEAEPQSSPLPYLVIIIDELADLMIVASKEVQTSLVRLAQTARAAGIHLILATQRPSVDVITGVIKANFPARISFQTSSKVDSRTILDNAGAEKLLGMGDMLFLPPGTAKLQRLSGTYVSEEEIKRVVGFWKNQGKPQYLESFGLQKEEETELALNNYDDEKYNEAVRLVINTGKASISMVQRHLRIGYNRAARLIERMEQEGIISPTNGIRPRQVLIKETKR